MTPATTTPCPAPGHPPPPVELTSVHAVMREQLDDLIAHAEQGACGCAACERYARVREALLEVFQE